MICDYCRRPVVTDSQGRCVNCGAPHETTQVGIREFPYLAPGERLALGGRLGAMLGGLVGTATAVAMFKE